MHLQHFTSVLAGQRVHRGLAEAVNRHPCLHFLGGGLWCQGDAGLGLGIVLYDELVGVVVRRCASLAVHNGAQRCQCFQKRNPKWANGQPESGQMGCQTTWKDTFFLTHSPPHLLHSDSSYSSMLSPECCGCVVSSHEGYSQPMTSGTGSPSCPLSGVTAMKCKTVILMTHMNTHEYTPRKKRRRRRRRRREQEKIGRG